MTAVESSFHHWGARAGRCGERQQGPFRFREGAERRPADGEWSGLAGGDGLKHYSQEGAAYTLTHTHTH